VKAQSLPYQFPDMAVEDKSHMMGFLSSTVFFAMPAIARWFRLLCILSCI